MGHLSQTPDSKEGLSLLPLPRRVFFCKSLLAEKICSFLLLEVTVCPPPAVILHNANRNQCSFTPRFTEHLLSDKDLNRRQGPESWIFHVFIFEFFPSLPPSLHSFFPSFLSLCLSLTVSPPHPHPHPPTLNSFLDSLCWIYGRQLGHFFL